MASSTPPNPSESQSYSTMSVGDVEAIGAHCQMPFCHQLDFLPFRCESCRGTYCLDHRTETAHSCTNAGAWARARREQAAASPSTPKPTVLTHESQCSQPTCKTLINTPLVPGIECAGCNRSYCLKHRMTEDHGCANLPPIGARTKDKEKRVADALGKLRAWGASKKAAAAAPAAASQSSSSKSAAPAPAQMTPLQRIVSPFTGRSRPSSKATQITALAALKRGAKGDAKVPPEKRVYVHLEAVASGEGHAGAKIPRGDAFYSAEWSVGRVLDAAAKTLDVTNVNNRGGGEEEKLRVFWIEGGRLLEFGEKLGAGPKSGDTLVLLRGVGAAMAPAPSA